MRSKHPKRVAADTVFRDFKGRNDALRSVTRYSIYKVMFYRTNLYTHSLRTAALVRAINPAAQKVFGGRYDPFKAEIMAYVHDDAEIIFGDVVAGNKREMSAAQLQAVWDAEARAIEEIANRFPNQVAEYNY